MRPSRVAAVVADQVDLHEPGPRVVPVGPGAHRDLTFEQRSRLGADTSLESILGSLTSQATIDGGRRHRHQQFRGVLIDDQLPEMTQHRDQFAEHGCQPAEREQWCLDNWDAVGAEVAAAHNVSLGVASHQMVVACALRGRLPRVADVFAAGHISYHVVNAIVGRTRLIKDPAAMGKVDAEVAAEVIGWGALSVAKTEAAIDYWVDRYDPHALVRTELSARGRHVDVVPTDGGTGLAWIEGTLFSTDAARLIRARSNSAALTHWARWPTAVTD
jgi:Domain of unknown function (DUF222)